jgi:hypothetical protein
VVGCCPQVLPYRTVKLLVVIIFYDYLFTLKVVIYLLKLSAHLQKMIYFVTSILVFDHTKGNLKYLANRNHLKKMHNIMLLNKSKIKAVPLHAMQALGGGGRL